MNTIINTDGVICVFTPCENTDYSALIGFITEHGKGVFTATPLSGTSVTFFSFTDALNYLNT